MSKQQVDVTVIVKKLQDKLGEALTTIAVLEAQLEMMQSQAEDMEPTDTI